MDDPQIPTEVQSSPGESSRIGTTHSPFSAPPPREPSNRGLIIGVAIAILVVGVASAGYLLQAGKSAALAAQNVVLPADSYASHLIFTQLAMSESTSLSGGKSTFIDGHVKNAGPDILTAVTVQVFFRNDVDLPPQVERVPLTLVRTHEPYVDVEPVSAAPVKPGDDVEFRLIFETVGKSWNQQMPDLLVSHVARR